MLTNKYSKLYYKITSNAKQHTTEGYTELHHIIPQSMGGSNDKENLVHLTAREHFICHWLLIKMTEGEDRSKMLYALNGMKAENRYQQRYHTKITARVYEKYRIEHAENHSKRMKSKNLVPWNKGGGKLTEEQLENVRHAARNRNIDPIKQAEGQQKRIAKMIGQKRTDETKRLMSLASKGILKGPQSDEHRLAISLGGKGIKKKEGHGSNVAKANIGCISINKNNTEKKVKKDVLQSYLDNGWQLGGKKRKLA
jgi:hypothetical protein